MDRHLARHNGYRNSAHQSVSRFISYLPAGSEACGGRVLHHDLSTLLE